MAWDGEDIPRISLSPETMTGMERPTSQSIIPLQGCGLSGSPRMGLPTMWVMARPGLSSCEPSLSDGLGLLMEGFCISR